MNVVGVVLGVVVVGVVDIGCPGVGVCVGVAVGVVVVMVGSGFVVTLLLPCWCWCWCDRHTHTHTPAQTTIYAKQVSANAGKPHVCFMLGDRFVCDYINVPGTSASRKSNQSETRANNHECPSNGSLSLALSNGMVVLSNSNTC